MKKQIPARLTHLLSLSLLLLTASPALGQSAAISYQGRLTEAGSLASGSYDMQFKLFDTAALGSGAQKGSTIPKSAVLVVNGIFTLTLDFGSAVFDGSSRFLEIAVSKGGSPYTTLAPRQQVASIPYAIQSLNAATAATALNVASGSVVKSLNNLKDNVTLAEGANVKISTSGNTLTIASTGGSVTGPNILGESRTPISSLPFTINASGSYYLTSNLTQRGGTAGITISADNVTVDLGGFALIGDFSGTGVGIAVPAARKNLQIHNGTIRNWNGGGVAASLAANSIYRDLRLSDNLDNGLFTGAGALVVDCVADNNIVGLSVGAGSTVRSCTVSGNLSDGIATGAGCTISGCTASGNNGNGILASTGCTVLGCTAMGNLAGDGIRVGAQSVVKDCASSGNSGAGITVSGDRSIVENCSADSNGGMGIVATGNGTGTVIRNCSATDNVSDGINVFRQCLVIGNISAGNGNGAPSAAGIHATSFSNRIEGNMVLSNDRGIHINGDGSNNLVIRNTATNNTIQFDIIANNKVGIIVSPGNSGAINGSTGGVGIGSSDPYVNISF